MPKALLLFLFCFSCLLAAVVWFPQIDLMASGLFYQQGKGFFLADNFLLVTLHWVAYDGARALGGLFVLGIVVSWLKKAPLCSLDTKAWLFLLLALVIGPGLVANVALKDHWGRSRPRDVVELGGRAEFSPALVPHFERAHSNGSFVAGDGAFGFFLPAFAYVVPRRLSRRVFWSSMGAGCAFGGVRLLMGAHFLSDVLFAAFFMLTTVALIHACAYGRKETAARWRAFFS